MLVVLDILHAIVFLARSIFLGIGCIALPLLPARLLDKFNLLSELLLRFSMKSEAFPHFSL